jgi:hypothetical protein
LLGFIDTSIRVCEQSISRRIEICYKMLKLGQGKKDNAADHLPAAALWSEHWL